MLIQPFAFDSGTSQKGGECTLKMLPHERNKMQDESMQKLGRENPAM